MTTEQKEDQERRTVIKQFYELYRRLQRKHNFRMHSRFSIYDDGLIEIWEYKGDKRIRNICKVKEEKEVDCYKRAIETLANYDN